MSTEDNPEWLGASGEESVLWSGQPRRKSVIKVALVFAVLAVAAGVVRLAALAVVVPLGVLVVGWSYLRVVNTGYALTDRSVYRRTGVLGESVERASVAKIQNVDLSKGVLGNRFGFGTVEVSTAGGRDLRVGNIVEPDEVKALVDECAKRSEGVGMDAGGVAAGVDPRQVERVREEARRLREVAESLEDTFRGGDA